MCGRIAVASDENVTVPPLAVTSTCCAIGFSVGLHRTTLRDPMGNPESENDPSAPTRAQWLIATTTTSARIFEWMLQKISTGPGLSNTMGGDVSPPLTEPR